MRRLRKLLGLLFLVWGGIRFVTDLLESVEATAKYAKWSYEHLSAPHSTLATVVIIVVGIGLIFAEKVQALVSESGIVGHADLLVQELDLHDLRITNGGAAYSVNLAAFVRMEIAVLDKPRTVTHFEIEMTARDGTRYRATSEYELGHYDHVHDVSRRDNWGFKTSEKIREPMEDLSARVRNPILPGTHAGRAWVRFEIPNVTGGHQPPRSTVRIYAVDPAGNRTKIATDNMQIKAIDDHEYAVARA